MQLLKKQSKLDTYKWISKEPEFKWNNNPTDFVDTLKSHESMAAINQCNQLLEAGLIRPSKPFVTFLFLQQKNL